MEKRREFLKLSKPSMFTRKTVDYNQSSVPRRQDKIATFNGGQLDDSYIEEEMQVHLKFAA
jgi:hypothetical protein